MSASGPPTAAGAQQARHRLAAALDAWRALLGEAHVVTDAAQLREAERTLQPHARRLPATLRPGSRDEVRDCLRIAARHGVALHPVSRGNNWGYGTRVPMADACVLMELHRLDRIVDFDEALGYVTVEPGVSFAQLHAFLCARGSRLMTGVPGSGPQGSVLGNVLERGKAPGPQHERVEFCGDLEVILSSGEVIRTGFGRYPGARVARLHRHGLGPMLDGLFSQSNFGVVTEMTVWLIRKPAWYEMLLVAFDGDRQLTGVIETLCELGMEGMLDAAPGLALESDSSADRAAPRSRWRTRIMPGGGLVGHQWRAALQIYAPNEAIAAAKRAYYLERLRPHIAGSFSIHERLLRRGRLVPAPLRRLLGIRLEPVHEALFLKNPALGVPRSDQPSGAYAEKRSGAMPDDADPARDRCGLIWCCPVVPMRGQDVLEALAILREVLQAHGFNEHVHVGVPNPRSAVLATGIYFDRELEGADEAAQACHDALLARFIAAGLIPYRLGLQSQHLQPVPGDDSLALLRRLKRAFDPHDVVAPGRYDLRHLWSQEGT